MLYSMRADPQLFGFEGATLTYFTNQGLEQFLPKPLAIKETAGFFCVEISGVGVQRHQAHQFFDQNVVFYHLIRTLAQRG